MFNDEGADKIVSRPKGGRTFSLPLNKGGNEKRCVHGNSLKFDRRNGQIFMSPPHSTKKSSRPI